MSFSCDQSLDGSFPPSPAEDSRGSNRLSWGNLLQRLTELYPRVTADQQRCSRSDTGSVADISLSESVDSSFYCYPLEETLATDVVAAITQSLQNASHTLGCSKLILHDCLLHCIGKELLHLAVSEPCGLRGALIDLCVERGGGDQDSLCTVDQIAVDADLVPTFHVTLVLRPESSGLWPKVQKLFKRSKSPPQTSPTTTTAARHQSTLRLSTGFRAIKRKLYCSGELLIEECC